MQIVAPDMIRIHRVAHRRSLRWVADKVGCSHTQIVKYEKGITREIRADWALTLAEVLEMPFPLVFKSIPEASVSKLSTGLESVVQAAS